MCYSPRPSFSIFPLEALLGSWGVLKGFFFTVKAGNCRSLDQCVPEHITRVHVNAPKVLKCVENNTLNCADDGYGITYVIAWKTS